MANMQQALKGCRNKFIKEVLQASVSASIPIVVVYPFRKGSDGLSFLLYIA